MVGQLSTSMDIDAGKLTHAITHPTQIYASGLVQWGIYFPSGNKKKTRSEDPKPIAWTIITGIRQIGYAATRESKVGKAIAPKVSKLNETRIVIRFVLRDQKITKAVKAKKSIVIAWRIVKYVA